MLDILRGIAVIGMVFHHTLVSYEIVFAKEFAFLYTNAFAAIQLVFVSVFLLVSGICTNYSHNVLRRGIIIFAAALLVSFATCIALPAIGLYGLEIYFGILHMFGLSMVLFAILKRFFDKIPTAVGIIGFILLFIGYYIFYLSEPMSDSFFLMIFGIMPYDILSYGDYYPLFPYAFLFFAGTFIGRYVRGNKFPKWFYSMRCLPLEICGKYSLWVYILHQPIIFGVLNLIVMLKK